MAFESTEIAVGILAVATIILAIIVIYQERRLNKILKGRGAKDLEDYFNSIESEYRIMKDFAIAMKQYLKTVENRLQKSIQGVSTVRFNAWKGVGEGGNQSFASAFVSEDGDGVILSSLHSRERVSIFAKPIKKGESQYQLTEEEKTALNVALDKIKIPSSK